MADLPTRDWLVESEVGDLLHSAVEDKARIREILEEFLA